MADKCIGRGSLVLIDLHFCFFVQHNLLISMYMIQLGKRLATG